RLRLRVLPGSLDLDLAPRDDEAGASDAHVGDGPTVAVNLHRDHPRPAGRVTLLAQVAHPFAGWQQALSIEVDGDRRVRGAGDRVFRDPVRRREVAQVRRAAGIPRLQAD